MLINRRKDISKQIAAFDKKFGKEYHRLLALSNRTDRLNMEDAKWLSKQLSVLASVLPPDFVA